MTASDQKNIRTYSRNGNLIEARRAQIAISAAALVARHGWASLNVRQVAKACNIGMGTLYHYIGSKEDILNLIIGYGLSKYQGFFEKIISARRTMKPVDALKYAIDLLCRTMDSNQDFALGFYREIKNASTELRDRMIEIENNYISSFELILKDGEESGDFHSNDFKLVANNIVVNGEMWAVRRGYLKKHYTIDSYIKEQTDLILKVLK